MPSSCTLQNGHAQGNPAPTPKPGQTRCYWSLLTPELSFLYLDPVLATHLGEQADLLIGKSLLTFVHPDEQDSARLDLGSVLDSRTLHGSVTRVRYSRLTRVRRQLGYDGPDEEWPDADKVAVDANYMAVDIVINWAADGLVLCFMHAVVDLTPRDNDEHHKTGWTNWCGTPYMSSDEIQLLYSRLHQFVSQPQSMTRVFQILLNSPERSLYMSWPPDQGQGGLGSKDFAKLAEDVQISSGTSSGTDAKTSCTRRYKALQMVHCGMDGNREVESIFIPHGAIIFACHKVRTYSRNAAISTTDISPSYNSPYYANSSHHHYDQPSHSYSLPPVPAPGSYNHGYPSQQGHSPSSYSSAPSWSQGSEPSSSHPHYNNHHQWGSQGAPMSSSWSSQPPPYLDPGHGVGGAGLTQSLPSPGLQYSAHEGSPPSPSSDVVPASRITHRRASGTGRGELGGGGRGSGNPPMGVLQCSSCKTTHSPEWRKGPSGKKDLCNACGLRYARSRAKKEGGVQRRRKDRAMTTTTALPLKPEHSVPPSPISSSYPGYRRGALYEENFMPGNGSAGGDIYRHHGNHPGLGGLTPSPSPPIGGNMQYGPYSLHSVHSHQNQQADARYHHGSHTFYSVPPPPPNAAMHHMPNNGHSGPASHRLEPIIPVSSRFSPLLSPVSPSSESPVSTSLSAASFEREKQREKDGDRIPPLPPTPVSADPRGKGGFMTQ
ncbi:hypothetical protein CERSUDRAFT_117628 [Gelatoporia subvermispora B]|uniref:GATA-type domain-containing protein n=1 Tax=Ceriporiopsis subvermispora (strain B) TaxID=914234 RepID=M2R6Y1_CERS8|nr:hypothetical protein CERSUDRAFT_117628 [Gelatoporia subvermispora B]